MVEQQIRVGAIARRGGRVLLHRMLPETWWAVPGGRLELGETSEQALGREMKEELGIEIGQTRLVAVIENRFEASGIRYEQLGLYFEMALATVPDQPFVRQDGELQLEFRWFALDELPEIDLRPRCVEEVLRSAGPAVVHLTQRDL